MSKHVHHIIPKHAGGTNSKENLIELTVEKHAEAHRILFEKYNRWQDYVAWKALSGQIDSDELRRLITKLVWTGRKHTEEAKEKIRKARARQVFSEETRNKMSKTKKGKKLSWDTKSVSPEANKKRSLKMSNIKKPKIECPHCKKIGGYPQMKQWHFDNCKERNNAR